jgi:hypothetical protein
MKLSKIILEGWNDNLEVSLTYTNGARLYSISINGEKQRGDDHQKAIEFIQKTTGVEVPTRAYYHDDEVSKVIDGLEAKGIKAGSFEMDVS